MALDGLSAVAAAALAGSLATERLVVVVKTLIPWLAAPAQDVALTFGSREQARRLAVNAIAIAAGLTTAWLIAGDAATGPRVIAVAEGLRLPWPVFGLMISGGSAFWTSIVAYASAAKDLQRDLALRSSRPQ